MNEAARKAIELVLADMEQDCRDEVFDCYDGEGGPDDKPLHHVKSYLIRIGTILSRDCAPPGPVVKSSSGLTSDMTAHMVNLARQIATWEQAPGRVRSAAVRLADLLVGENVGGDPHRVYRSG